MRIRCALLYATLTCALALITTVYAAPLNEPATTTAEGLDATLEISKLGADLFNSIPNEFPTPDGATLQPYASAEVDTVAELAPTSLPMTKEEMALAEVAAVVAELATTTAAELKVKEEAKYTEDEEEEAMAQIWRKAEEVKRQVIAHELANAVEPIEGGRLSDEKDFVAVPTTLRTSFVDTGAATTMSPATTESPQILTELVRAAAAANEILAAALNAANLAVTSNNMTTTTAVAANEITTATTMQPMLATEAEAGSDDGLVDANARMSDSEGLSEVADAITWRPKVIKTEASNVDVEKPIGDSNAATATTTISTVEPANTDTTSDLNILGAADGGEEEKLNNSPEIQTSTQLDFQETTTTAASTKSVDEVDNEPLNVVPILWRAGEFLLEHNHSVVNKEEMPIVLIGQTNEAAESATEHLKIIESESTERTLESIETTTISGDIYEQSTELPKDFEASTPHPNNVADVEVAEEDANIVETANQGASQATNNDKEFSETQIAEVIELKQAQMVQDDSSQVNETAHTITATTTFNLNENSTLIPSTTEPLETLIAVESEAQKPNKIVLAFGNELEEETTTTTSDENRTTENVAPLKPIYSDLIHQEATTITATGTPDETEASTGSRLEINSETSLTTTTPAPAQRENAFTPATPSSADQPEYTTILLVSNLLTTTPTSVQTEPPNMSEVTAVEAVPVTTARSMAEALEISLDTKQLPTTTISTAEQHEETTQFSAGAEEITTLKEITTAPDKVPKLQTTTAVPQKITTSSAERIQGTSYLSQSRDSSTEVPLAPFTTMPRVIEELIKPEVSTRQSESEAYAVLVGSTEIPQPVAESSPETTNAADTFAATLSSDSTSVSATETTTTLATNESVVPDLATPAAAEGELNANTVEPAVEAKTLEALVEPVADPAVTNSALIEEQSLYTRTTAETQQQQAFSDSESESKITTATNTVELTRETAVTTIIPNEVDITTTTSAPEPRIITTTPFEPETTTTTTTTTTTLSPMSLIVAEHEARSLDRTPPRVNRIVSADGVEVLTGYSIVHHIYAAALASLEAGGA